MAAPTAASDGQRLGTLAARRFPLTPRPKPACRPLSQRIDRVIRLAGQASQATSDTPLRAAEACNLAALIASDCAMPAFARDLCWHQFEIYTAAGPYDAATAKLALQPLINLARLRIRDDDGDGGYQIVQSLYDGVRSSQDQAAVDGRAVNLASLAAPGDDHKAIVQWLWTVVLSDGLRSLCRAGDWTAALHQAQQHHGIGQRLLDGRQIAVLAHAASGQHDEAERLLKTTTGTEPWENVVADCLRAITRATESPAGLTGATGRLPDAYLALDDPGRAMFNVRLGLTVGELIETHDDQRAVIGKVERIAVQTADAYIAREVLSSPATDLRREVHAKLRRTIDQASLGHPLGTAQVRQLTDAVEWAGTSLAASLASARALRRRE